MIWVGLVILGLCLGSFVNALVWRMHEQLLTQSRNHPVSKRKSSTSTLRLSYRRNLSILWGRSMCPKCHHELGVKDLIPIISWVLLRSKCRYCNQSISWQYPLVELLVVLLFVVSYAWWSLGFNAAGVFNFIFWLIFLTIFVALGVYDFRWFLLPNRLVYPLIGLVLIKVITNASLFNGGWLTIIHAFWGVIFLAGLFYLLYLISRGAWIGFGDVKLAIGLGLIAGSLLSSVVLLFMASVAGSLIAAPLLIQGKAKITTRIPFGPLLLLSTIAVVLLGGHITDWYNGLFYFH